MQRREASPGGGPTHAEEEETVKGEICREFGQYLDLSSLFLSYI